jgi:phosphatidylglycerol:prolipoprotein diacylglycerol transferase
MAANKVDLADAGWLVLWLGIVAFLCVRIFQPSPDATEISFGPFSSFGVLGALNFVFAWYLARRACLGRGLDWTHFRQDLVWLVLGGYFISHLVSLALYFPERLSDPVAWVDPRWGISSFGGIYGGTLLAVPLLRRRGWPVWEYMDAMVYGFIGGYAFGRAGCFSVHDHPGRETDFFLGVDIGGVHRHDLGFYEMWLVAAMTIALTALGARRRVRPGLITAWAATIYGPARVFLDSLRVGDARYGSLTPGQWFGLLTTGVAVWAWVVVARSGVATRPLEDHPVG